MNHITATPIGSFIRIVKSFLIPDKKKDLLRLELFHYKIVHYKISM